MYCRKKIKNIMAGVLSCVMISSVIPSVFADEKEELIIHYDFENAQTSGDVYGGVEIKNGYAYFDGEDDYIKLPDNVISGCESATFVINVRPENDGVNQFLYTVGTGESNYLFLNPNNGVSCRFAMTDTGWWNEYEVAADPALKGEWASVAVVADGHALKMYINGELKGESQTELLVSGLGNTDRNYIAKSQYSSDSYFKGYIDDFRIYSAALGEEEIKAIAEEHMAADVRANVVADRFEFDFYNLAEDAILPKTFEGAEVTWESSDESVMTSDGVITRGEEDRKVTLKGTFTLPDGSFASRDYVFNIVHMYTDTDIAQLDLMNIHLVGNLLNLKEDLYLPTESVYGSTITWRSSDESVITSEGKIFRAKSTEGDRHARLTAVAAYRDAVCEKEYEIVVKEEDFAYLFAYFTGNDPREEKVFYGLSRDGYNFNAINNSNPVLESTKGHKCVRDPFIMQGQNGMYYCILTDMRSRDGWASQSSIIIFESEDLINWDDGTVIDFNDYGWYNRAWAPQAIWDSEFYDETTGEYGAYMIYLALSSGGPTQMYKVYTKDMKSLITSPELFYSRNDEKSDIDGDIIYKDGTYYMYVKDESDGGIFVVTSSHAGGPYSERVAALPRSDAGGHNVAVEGSGIYKLMNENKYHIVYDAYNAGFFVMSETEDLVNFNQLDRSEYSFDFTPRHGYVITISKAETDALEEKYGKSVKERIEASKNPIIYYDFEDERDKSGNFNDAELASGAGFAEGLSGGKGLFLDGTSESYAIVPSLALAGLEDYTISAWINTKNTNTTQRIFDFGTGNQRYMFLTPYYGKGIVRGAITAGGYTNEKGTSINKLVEPGTWTHMVMSQEGDTLKIYIDGVLSGQETGVTLDPYELSYEMPYCYIGKSMFSSDKYFKGVIDEFMIYDRAISDSEVLELYMNGAPDESYTSLTDSEIVYNHKAAGKKCTAVIAQYDDNNIMIAAKRFELDKDTDERISVEKNGTGFKVLLFDSVESLKPFR